MTQQIVQINLYSNLFFCSRMDNGFQIKDGQQHSIKDIQLLQMQKSRIKDIKLRNKPFALRLAHYILYKDFLSDQRQSETIF